MKKIWIFVLSFIAIFFVWISFADVIEPNTHRVDRCVKIQNVNIDWYKAIQVVEPPFDWAFYEIKKDECLHQHYKFGQSYVYLVKEPVNVDSLTPDNFQKGSILVDRINPNWWYVDDSNPLTSENLTYKIVKNWDDYKLEEIDGENMEIVDEGMDYSLELIESEQWIELVSGSRFVKFWIARLVTILIETIVLFAIAKLFRKENQISSWRILLIGILASTVTLPLLRFVLPLFIVDWFEYTVIWELSVILIEILIIKYWLKVSRCKAIIASIVCNLCSYLLGLLIF